MVKTPQAADFIIMDFTKAFDNVLYRIRLIVTVTMVITNGFNWDSGDFSSSSMVKIYNTIPERMKRALT